MCTGRKSTAGAFQFHHTHAVHLESCGSRSLEIPYVITHSRNASAESFGRVLDQIGNVDLEGSRRRPRQIRQYTLRCRNHWFRRCIVLACPGQGHPYKSAEYLPKKQEFPALANARTWGMTYYAHPCFKPDRHPRAAVPWCGSSSYRLPISVHTANGQGRSQKAGSCCYRTPRCSRQQ